MNLRAILAALSLDALVASAADTSATVKALANTLHIMMDLSSLTADAAIDIFPSTVGRFLSVSALFIPAIHSCYSSRKSYCTEIIPRMLSGDLS